MSTATRSARRPRSASAEVIAPTGADFVDGGIIGGPPRPNYSPTIYASGPTAGQTAVLRDWGIDWRVIDGPIGAASALKMSYAGITKGTTAIAAAMLLGAARFGCGEALIAELTESQPEMLARMRSGIPRMYDKAYRWVAEMEEISDFLEKNPPSRDIYAAVARLYADLAAAYDDSAPGPDNAVKVLDRRVGKGERLSETAIARHRDPLTASGRGMDRQCSDRGN